MLIESGVNSLAVACGLPAAVVDSTRLESLKKATQS
jgi:hypothetical protein